MYYVTCDGFPLLDCHNNNLILVNPKVKLEVNTVGECSFAIYNNHPNYDKIKKLKSVIEVSDETSVIFRGRATGDSIDIDNGMSVDVEGVMAYFNDSIVRPFSFPSEFTEKEDYIAASESGNVIQFFLSWLIDNHNSQVQDFQKLKLGNVTVTDPNNYITRSNSSYASTWDTLKSKLFDSSLGGYLCIRYEPDGNYIDYLSEFTDVNTQTITFGKNILDLIRETELSSLYSACIPLGAADITIEGHPDKDLTDDIVKKGDTIYSKKAVEEYGWIYAPTSETTWDDVTDDANLVKKAGERLANGGIVPTKGIEVTALDLHFTDEQIESFRIYKNVNVYSKTHGLTEQFQLSKLEIELLSPQNTRITVGKTFETLTDKTSIIDDEMIDKWSKISKTADEIKLEVVDKVNNLESELTQTTHEINLSVQNLKTEIGHTVRIAEDGVTITNASGDTLTIDGGQIDASKIKAEELDASKINAGDLNMTGTLSWSDFSDSEAETALKLDANGLVCTGSGGSVTISGSQIDASGINAEQIDARKIHAENLDASKINASDLQLTGVITWGDLSATAKNEIDSTAETKATSAAESAVSSVSAKATAAQERADSAYDLAGTANTTANSAKTTANSASSNASSALSKANSAYSIANSAYDKADANADTLASFIKTGTTYIDGSKIYSDSLYASSIHLGGDLTVYTTEKGTTAAGKLGYTSSANDGSAGMHMQKGSGEVVVTANGAKLVYGSTSNQVYISNGNGGIFASGTHYMFQQGVFRSSNKSTLGSGSALWGQIYSTNSAISTSDANMKNSIEDLPDKYLDLFDGLVPKRYKLNDGTSDRYHVGFISQEVESAMEPAGVDSKEFGGFVKDVDSETGEDIYFLRYEEFIGILVAKIKQLEGRINDLMN
jgi:hypothetical protein